MNCVSLFSGCGGLDLGIQRAGFEIAIGVDNEPNCAASHSTNFPGTPFYLGSIATFVDDLAAGAVEALEGIEVDLVVGGPPCPPYSKSRFYRKDKPRALKDDVGWVTMKGYLDTVELLRPRAFLLENVAGFAYKVHRDALDHFLARAGEAGYQCTWRVVNAADYGVPQIRERFFLIGSREDACELPEPTHGKEEATDIFGSRQLWRTAGEAIGDLDTPENAEDAGHFAGGQHHDLLCKIPPGDNYLYFTAKRGHPDPKFEWRSRYWSFLLKLSPDMPSWTIQARRSNNMGPFHWRNRILRIAEVKRLQTFPDDWDLRGTVEQQWRQVGNAVPPLLAEALGRKIADHLRSSADDELERAA